MKEYLVYNNNNNNNKVIAFIVSAKDAKDALYQVCKKYDVHMKNLKARSLGSLHNEKGKIIKLNI